MPWRDRTGPSGQGPMTGWGMGDCVAPDSEKRPGERTPVYPAGGFFGRRFYRRGSGFGSGRGFGRGFGFRFRRWW